MSARAAEVVRIAASMTAACAIGATILGGVYVATDRYQEAARAATERRAVAGILGLKPEAEVRVVDQLLSPAERHVIYREEGGGTGESGVDSELVFTYEGRLVRRAPASQAKAAGDLVPVGRLFVASEGGELRGFVVEGESRGYKNRIRFFVGLDAAFGIAGVEVLEHEEDPGLGAEVAKPWFERQFAGRPYEAVPGLDVTRDPLPEDWRAALLERNRLEPREWNARHRALVNRMTRSPIYAVTGATISSRALTDGVRNTVLHFERRWQLLAPYLGAERNARDIAGR